MSKMNWFQIATFFKHSSTVVGLFLLFMSLTSKAQIIKTSLPPLIVSTVAANSAASASSLSNELPAVLVNDLLIKCSLNSLESCDMCSLCQNGAFCKQTTKSQHNQQSTTTSNKNIRVSNTESALALLRTLIDFTCYCVPGYTGTYCQIDINECLSMPCSNNATCIDHINAYECKCPSGFGGEHCEVNLNECDSSPCMNDAKCIDLIDGYYCDCMPGYAGLTCSIDINECASQPCQNNVTCVDLINRYECNCTNTGYEGKHCENNVDDCAQVTCQHNGTCVDLLKAFACECMPGYTGKHCEIDIDECVSSPCGPNGICFQNSDETAFERRKLKQHTITEFSYSTASGYWCECEPGFTGRNCEIKINECESSPCGYNGKCVDLINAYKCLCFPGYTGINCMQNIDECSLHSPCAPQTKCVDLHPDYKSFLETLSPTALASVRNVEEDSLDPAIQLATYYCDCSDLNENLFRINGNQDIIYAGQNCTLKLNACETMKQMCMHNSTCQSVLASNALNSNAHLINMDSNANLEQDIMCTCKAGYTGKYCQYETTLRLDGTYSLSHKIASELVKNDLFHLHFDFKLRFFHKYQRSMPLLYVKSSTGELIFEVTLRREYFSIRNKQLDVDEKIAFYNSPIPKSIENEQQETEPWHSLDLIMNATIANNRAASLQLIYTVKQMHLTVARTLNNTVLFKYGMPGSFTIGKYYYAYQQQQYEDEDETTDELLDEHAATLYLNGACMRDIVLNGLYLFKENRTVDSNSKNTQVKIKYGCKRINNPCIEGVSFEQLSSSSSFSPFQTTNSSSFSYSILDTTGNADEASQIHGSSTNGSQIGADLMFNKKHLTSSSQTTCNNNSTCVYKWFDFECIECRRPFYGKMCQHESNKLVFVNTLNNQRQQSDSQRIPVSVTRSSTLTLARNRSAESISSSNDMNAFEISFKLNRLMYDASGNFSQSIQPVAPTYSYYTYNNDYYYSSQQQYGFKDDEENSFLLLRQDLAPPNRYNLIYYYLLSINSRGMLNLKKYEYKKPLNPSYAIAYNMKLIWSLTNDKVNLNERISYGPNGVKLKVKLNDKLCELSVNDTYMSRYELSTSGNIGGIHDMAWYDVYASGGFNAFNTPDRPTTSSPFFISQVSFGSFDSRNIQTSNGGGAGSGGISSGLPIKQKQGAFAVYDLKIDEHYYELRSSRSYMNSKSTLKMFVLSPSGKIVEQQSTSATSINKSKSIGNSHLFRLESATNVNVFAYKYGEIQLITEMNKNKEYCAIYVPKPIDTNNLTQTNEKRLAKF
jgi:hypothetical protein